MGLFRAIVGGFGFTLGARAADAAIEEVADGLEEEAAPTPVKPIDAAALARAAAVKEKEKKARARKVEREVDRELAAMKKRLHVS